MPVQKNYLLILPIFGILLFVLLYVIATLYYPGGSQADKNAAGFSWQHNYWCNLLNENAVNGQPNPAKPIALAAMLVLFLTFSLFWALFPVQMKLPLKLKCTIQVAGILSMTSAFFLFTSFNHDMVVNIISLLGVVATIGAFVALYQVRWLGLFGLGLFSILLVGLDNYIYYVRGMIIYLPVMQKITFAAFLIWMGCISFRLYKSSKNY